MQATGSFPREVPHGHACFVAVKQIKPGLRARFFFVAPSHTETDVSERSAQNVINTMLAKAQSGSCGPFYASLDDRGWYYE